jgi:cell shape-determining protein MreD
MRWIPFIILVYVVLVVQSSLGLAMGFGGVSPDLLAVVAVAVALWAPNAMTAMLAAWVLGFALDLTITGATGGLTVAGPMSLAYLVGARLIFNLREIVYNDRVIIRGLLAGVFCIVTHGLWVLSQCLLTVSWSDFPRLMGQGAGVALYTAIVAPIGCWMLWPARGLLFEVPVHSSRRARRSGR